MPIKSVIDLEFEVSTASNPNQWGKSDPNPPILTVENFANGVDECQPIELDAADLTLVARKLEKWADDPSEFAPKDGFFFGVRPEDEHYEEVRDEYRKDAVAEAQTLYRAVDWLKADTEGREYRSITYQASW